MVCRSLAKKKVLMLCIIKMEEIVFRQVGLSGY